MHSALVKHSDKNSIKDALCQEFAMRLRALRDAAGMTRAEAGQKMDYKDRTIRALEEGTADFNVRHLAAMQAAFGVDVRVTIGEDVGAVSSARDEEELAILTAFRQSRWKGLARLAMANLLEP